MTKNTTDRATISYIINAYASAVDEFVVINAECERLELKYNNQYTLAACCGNDVFYGCTKVQLEGTQQRLAKAKAERKKIAQEVLAAIETMRYHWLPVTDRIIAMAEAAIRH